jgi:protein-S-isoprenylcysteine O-methyltransferase Ste14
VAQDVPGLGPFRPPLVYLISLVTGVWIQRAALLPFVPGTLAVPLGASLIVVAMGLIHCVVIPREERYLERRFGAQYSDYKISVRRWL